MCSVWGVVGVREPHVCTLMCYSYAQSNNTMEVQRHQKVLYLTQADTINSNAHHSSLDKELVVADGLE